MKISARNVIAGKLVSITKGVASTHLKIEVAPGLVLSALITSEGAEDLDLQVGDAVSAIIKASDVMIGK